MFLVNDDGKPLNCHLIDLKLCFIYLAMILVLTLYLNTNRITCDAYTPSLLKFCYNKLKDYLNDDKLFNNRHIDLMIETLLKSSRAMKLALIQIFIYRRIVFFDLFNCEQSSLSQKY